MKVLKWILRKLSNWRKLEVSNYWEWEFSQLGAANNSRKREDESSRQ